MPERNSDEHSATLELWPKNWGWLAVALAIAISAVVRVPLLEAPLERDEGEYAYMGRLLLEGELPYVAAYNMKAPGIYVAYAAMLGALGESVWAIRMGLMVVNALTAICIYLLMRVLYDDFAGALAVVIFAIVTMGQPVQGLFANAEHFVLLPALAGILLLVIDERRGRRRAWRIFVAGALLGTAVMIKQHGAVFPLFGIGYLAAIEIRLRPSSVGRAIGRFALFAAGGLLPLAIVCIIYLAAGALDRFWFWTVVYASHYATAVPTEVAVRHFAYFLNLAVIRAPGAWFVAAIGFLCLWMTTYGRPRRWWLTGFTIASFAAVCPGGYFRPHYFLFVLPAISMLVAIALTVVARQLAPAERPWGRRLVASLVLAIAVGGLLHEQATYLFRAGPVWISWLTFGREPFVSSPVIGEFLRDHTGPEDSIAVIGSEPQIYFYSGRRAATGFVYTYSMMERHEFADELQRTMIREIEEAQPRYVLYANNRGSWHSMMSPLPPNAGELLFDWFKSRCATDYERVAVFEWGPALPETRGVIHADGDDYEPESENWIAVYRRKE